MSFRKRKKPVFYSTPTRFVDVTQDSPDSPRSLVTCTADEYLLKHPIPLQEYTLTDQLQSGVPLKEINCSHLLDSRDNLDYSQSETAEQILLNQLENDTSKE